jgi:hypothetical protein
MAPAIGFLRRSGARDRDVRSTKGMSGPEQLDTNGITPMR